MAANQSNEEAILFRIGQSVLPKDSGGRIEITIDTYQGKGIYIMISDTVSYICMRIIKYVK